MIFSIIKVLLALLRSSQVHKWTEEVVPFIVWKGRRCKYLANDVILKVRNVHCTFVAARLRYGKLESRTTFQRKSRQALRKAVSLMLKV